MNAQEIVKALGGRWHGADGTARCPAHDDHEPSLSVRDGDGGRLLTHCFSGCSAEAVWAALRGRGLVAATEDRGVGPTPRRALCVGGRPTDVNHRRRALKIWCATRPAEGSPVETYLRGRGITIPIPYTIRYHPALLHPDIGQHLPCMVAAVCNVTSNITGIMRTFLTMNGRKAPLKRPRMALGALSYINIETRNRRMFVQAFHTFPDDYAIVKSQSMFEIPRRERNTA